MAACHAAGQNANLEATPVKYPSLDSRSKAQYVAALLSVFLIATGLLLRTASAQSSDAGALFGSITDNSGAVVPGATVVVTNTATGSKKSVSTNPSGFYAAESLPAGDYKISVAKQGFATVDVNNVHIEPGQRREV